MRADRLLAEGRLTADDARQIAIGLAERHARLPTRHSGAPDAESLAREHEEAIAGIVRDVPDLATNELRRAGRHQRDFLESHEDRLLARIADDRIRGSITRPGLRDVHLEREATSRIAIRESGPPRDVCQEVAALSIDLLVAARVDAAESLIGEYAGRTGDFGLYEFVNYYEFSVALQRAAEEARRIARIADPEKRESGPGVIRRLIAIALASDRREPRPPFLLAVGGQVATGKSTLAQALADRLALPRVISDRIRDQLLHGTSLQRAHEADWATSFTSGFHERVYAELFRRADLTLASGRAVILDGCFARARDRTAAMALARRHGVPFRFVELKIDEVTRSERLAHREAMGSPGGWKEIAQRLASEWEPIDSRLEELTQRLEGDASIEENVARIVAKLPRWPDPAQPGTPLPPSRGVLPRSPRIITFDCWNTLIREADWPRAHDRRVDALLRAAREAGRKTTRAEASAAFEAGWAHQMACWRDGIRAGAREVAIHALRELGLREPHPALEHLIHEYEEASHSGQVLAIEGALDCLVELARRGLRHALICDTGLTPGRVVRRHLDRLGLLEHLEVCVFSDEIGAPKPDSRLFHAALDHFGVEPERAIHVGDLRRTDVAGARAVGMSTIRIRALNDDRSDLPDADVVVESHAELLGLLLPLLCPASRKRGTPPDGAGNAGAS